VPVIGLTTGIYPVAGNYAEYARRFWPYALAVELFLAGLGQGQPYEDVWRSRQTWLGMAPVYARATIAALLYGPRHKPTYRVTRKENRKVWHLGKVIPQMAMAAMLLGASVYHLATRRSLQAVDLGSLFWAALFLLALSRTVRNSWYGVDLRAALAGAFRRRAVDAVPTDEAE
jgi:hypothetical protein